MTACLCKIFTALLVTASLFATEPGPDVTDSLEDLGIPYGKRYAAGERMYARNPWDLQAYQGYLYMGAGNSSNLGPARNAGPVPILRVDPRSNEVERVFQVDDEQIDLFYVFDGQLYVPGHDPRESWELGNFYRLEKDGQWVKHRTVPGGIHVYCMARHEGKLFAGTGTTVKTEKGRRGRSAVCISEDDGATWREEHLGLRRIHAFLQVQGTLFAVDVLMDETMRENWARFRDLPMISVFEHLADGSFRPREDLQLPQLFPGYPKLSWHFREGKPVKPVSFGERSVYIGGAVANDHQFLPFGLFVADSLAGDSVEVRRAALPDQAMPWDVMVQEDMVYALASLNLHGEITNAIYASSDTVEWKEVCRFRTPTFARSFERLDGVWYVALGCRIGNPQIWGEAELHPDTGRLFRIAP